MNRALRPFLLALVCAIPAWSLARTKGAAPPTLPQPSAASSVGFSSTARLVEHYQKHGREFGSIRTFFKPNDGEAYFRRQARRSPQS